MVLPAPSQLGFNPLDRGNLYQILGLWGKTYESKDLFQSPRSGKFVSDLTRKTFFVINSYGFNPLDRGNLYQIGEKHWSHWDESMDVSIP